MANEEQKIAQLENEVRVLKNEVQAVLLDLRERFLDAENPFNDQAPVVAAAQQIIIDRQAPAAAPANTRQGNYSPAAEAKENAPEAREPSEPTGTDPVERSDTPLSFVHNQVKKVPPVENPLSRIGSTEIPGDNSNGHRQIDLVIVSGLARWAVESVARVGRQRTETILEISAMMGYLPSELKQIMIKLVNTDVNGQTDAVVAREYLDSLIKLTTLLGKDNKTETAMLSVLSGEDNHR